LPWHDRQRGKNILKKFSEGDCDHLKLAELLDAAGVSLSDICMASFRSFHSTS